MEKAVVAVKMVEMVEMAEVDVTDRKGNGSGRGGDTSS
jgi:hypothetical protein